MAKKIIGILGFIGSGKGTAGDHLVKQYGFHKVSFAASLKDAVASIFRWPRHLLEGDTEESRAWREAADPYWSKKFGFIVTPRWVLQKIGTNVMRDHFHQNIWIWSLEKQLIDLSGDIVITDVRFVNEIQVIRNLGGETFWVKRDPDPPWLNCALTNKAAMPVLWPNVHDSEWDWLDSTQHKIILNNGSLVELYQQIDNIIIKDKDQDR